jgi:hypothetical protein
MPRWRPGALLCRKVGRVSPQPWSRTRQTLLPPRRQLTDACPLSDTPAGTTSSSAAPVPAGQRTNRTSVFITGVTDTRGFLAWLRSRCLKGLTAQMKGENLMVPETADRCARLIKNLGRSIPEMVVRGELEALGICVQGIMHLRSGRRDQNPEKRAAQRHRTS